MRRFSLFGGSAFLTLVVIAGLLPGVALAQPRLDSTHIRYDIGLAGSISTMGEVDTFTFDGTAMDKVFLRVFASWWDPWLELYDPDDSLIWEGRTSSGRVNLEDYVLPATGRYTIFMRDEGGDEVGTYELYLQCRQLVRSRPETLHYDMAERDTIASCEDMQAYVLDGSAGDKVFLRVFASWWDPWLELYDPDDSLIWEGRTSSGRVNLEDYVLPATGRYTIFMRDEGGDEVGTYELSLWCRQSVKARADTILLGATRRDTLLLLGQMDAYILSIEQPVVLNLRMVEKSGGFDPRLELFNPRDSLLAANSGWREANLTGIALAPGAYTIFCSDEGGDGTGSYDLSANPPPDSINNDFVRIHFDHSKGCIDQLTWKQGSHRELLTDWNIWDGRGLARVKWEDNTLCRLGQFGADTAYLEYANPDYGSKKMLLKWGPDIGLEMRITLELARFDQFQVEAVWQPGGDNEPPFDSVRIITPDSSFTVQVPYPGGSTQFFYEGPVLTVGNWDGRFDEVAGFSCMPELHARCGSGSGLDCPWFDIPGPDTVTLWFAVKDSSSFWSWGGNYDHNVGPTRILAPAGRVPPDTVVIPTAVVRNLGRFPETFPVLMRIGSDYEDTVTVTLEPGQWDTAVFSDWRATQRGTFVVACSTMLDGDEYPRNDKKTGTVTVSSGGLEIYSVTPNYAGDLGRVMVDIVGAGFDSGAVAKLTRSGQTAVVDSVVEYIDPAHLVALLDLTSRERGPWDIVVVNPRGDSGVFYGGFSVESASEVFWVDIVGRDVIQAGREETYVIRYGNAGNVDVECASVFLGIPHCAGARVLMQGAPDSLVFVPESLPDYEGDFVEIRADLGRLRVGIQDALRCRLWAGRDTTALFLAALPVVNEFAGELDDGPDATSAALLRFGDAPPSLLDRAITIELLDAEGINDHGVPRKRRVRHPFFIMDDGMVYTQVERSGVRRMEQHDRPWFNLLKNTWKADPYVEDGYVFHSRNVAFTSGSKTVTDAQYSDFKRELVTELYIPTSLDCMLQPDKMAERAHIPPHGFIGFWAEFWFPWYADDFARTFSIPLGSLPNGELSRLTLKELFFEDKTNCSRDEFQRRAVTRTLPIVRSRDPNDKAGPAGFGDAGFVPPYEQFQYVIYFENVDTATAPAEDIVITDTLDSDLDWSTFAMDTSSHRITSTSFDSTTGVVTWRFEDINLPPNRTPPEGEGWLSYTINPKPNLPTGTEIRNRAWIVFDVNEPMSTGDWLNTIDAGPPSSRVLQMPEDQPLTSFAVQLAGSDDQGGSGIRSYDIYVSDNDSGFTFWRSTESTSVVYTGVNGHTYKFYSVARDNVGHVEDAPAEPDAVTTVKLPTGVEVSPNPFVPKYGHTAISFFGDGLSEAEIKVFNKAGELVKTIKPEETKDKDRLDWDAKNEDGKPLASGVYVYVAKEKSGEVRKGKFAIIR